MAKRFENNLDYLSVLRKCKPKQRSYIIRTADKQLIDVICDCVENILAGTVPISTADKKKLIKYKNTLRELRSKKHVRVKRKILNQSGGFLPALLTPLLGVVGGLLTDLILKR